MPLHPEIEALLANVAASGTPAFHANPPAVTRAVFRAITASLPPSAASIARTEDLAIPGPAGDIGARAYVPGGSGPFPVVVYFHGGGFVFGDLETHDTVCRDLCAGVGAVVVAIDYRLAPEHPFPAATDDCYAATRWVAEHAARWGGDARRLAVAGDSAGGNLATTTARRIRDSGGPALAAQLLVYPVTDHYDAGHPSMQQNADGYLLTRADLEWMYGHYLPRREDRANPLFAAARAGSLKGLPPAMVITAEFDPLRDEGEAYGAALKAAGVDTVVKRYEGAIHGFYSFATVLTLGRQAMEDTSAWLASKLR